MKYLISCFLLTGTLFANDFDKGMDMIDQGNFAKAAEYFQEACEGGYVGGCRNLGFMYVNAQGVKQDKSKAKQLFGKACDMRLQQGCEAYRILNEQGH